MTCCVTSLLHWLNKVIPCHLVKCLPTDCLEFDPKGGDEDLKNSSFYNKDLFVPPENGGLNNDKNEISQGRETFSLRLCAGNGNLHVKKFVLQLMSNGLARAAGIHHPKFCSDRNMLHFTSLTPGF